MDKKKFIMAVKAYIEISLKKVAESIKNLRSFPLNIYNLKSLATNFYVFAQFFVLKYSIR